MQRLYTRLLGSAGVRRFKLNGAEVAFSARTPVELRCVEGAWFGERDTLKAVQESLDPGDAFLDVGSNLGLLAVFAARAVGPHGTVVACEPETKAYNRLERNIEINQLKNVRLLKLALSDKRSTRRLALGDPGGVSQSAHLSDADVPSEDVQTVDYDSLVADEGLPIPRVIKMDIEGHEYIALQGMKNTLSSPSCVALFCEVHPSALPGGISIRDVVTLIESFGFECVSTKPRVGVLELTAMKRAALRAPEKRDDAGTDNRVGR